MMKAMVCTKYEAPDVLQLQEVEKPVPKNDKVLIKLHAITATTASVIERIGKPHFLRLFFGLTKPRKPILRQELAGEIGAIGGDVKSFKVWDKGFGGTVQKVPLLVATLFLASCSSMIQSASVSEAYKKYELQKFERTLDLITRAENARATTPEVKAELTYLKARTHESLGEQEIANILYEYLSEQHRDSQYGYLASKKLNSGL